MITKMNFKIKICASIVLISGITFAENRVIRAKELAEHANKQSCWIVVNDGVYDLTEDLERHSRYPKGLEEYCGKDGSEAWHSKGSLKKPHSKKAEVILKKYRIGSWQKN